MSILSRVEAARAIRELPLGYGQVEVTTRDGSDCYFHRAADGALFFAQSMAPEGEGDSDWLDSQVGPREVLSLVKRHFERHPRVYVNAYSVHRAYGGPEEGGWYYDAREPLASVPVIDKGDDVETVIRILTASLGWENPRGRYSVVGGPDFEIVVEAGEAKATEPRTYQ